MAFSLDAGETECLALLASDARALFLTDDAAARLVAERLGYSVHGTIGVLTRSIRTGSRTATQVLQLLDELPAKSTLFIRRSLLAEVIDTVRRSTGR
jgi:predicted nucleic acid-binding protein